MDLRGWLIAELDDVSSRLERQVLDQVPRDRRRERPGGGNSILWGTLHLARHADLAVAVLTAREPERGGGDGLGEAEEPWAASLDPAQIEGYARRVLATAREWVASSAPGALEEVPEATASLRRADVPEDRFAWLFDQWNGQPAAFFLRWPVIGHATSHIGEMIATRNRMGLSPYGN